MKNKIFFKILVVLIVTIMLFGNFSFAIETVVNAEENTEINEFIDEKDNIAEEQKANTDSIKVEYEYDENANQVIAKIISAKKLKNTKPTWKLSEDGFTYAKIFSENTKYSTQVENINGEVINVEVNVVDVKKTEIQIKYEYNTNKTQVTVKIVSNVKLKNTKPTWKLSEDKFTYSKVFTSNTQYTTPVEDVCGNTLTAKINVNGIQTPKANVSTKNTYDETTNKVVVKIISDVRLKNTKPTWQLSSDGLTYTKTYAENTDYATPVEDIYGNIINVQIKVTEIKTTQIKVENKYDDVTNTTTVNIISNIKLKNTKPTWQLSSDGLIYTKVFTDNMNYSTSVEDIFGNIINVSIKVVEIDKEAPEITVEYIYNKDDTLTAKIISNKRLKDTKPTWKLSSDGLVYTKTFATDQNYSTGVQDYHGNSANAKINFKIRKFIYNQNDNSTIKVRYLYIGKTQATVEIISSIKLKNTKPTWNLSEDGYTYSKTFYSNQIYGTTVVDINGVSKNVNIIVNLFDNYLTGIDVSSHQGRINWSEVKNAGIDFAIIRCGYGQDITSQDDYMFVRNVLDCERLGIPYGVYLYSYALTESDAYSEANHALRLIKGHNPTLGVWIDIEDADGYKQKYGMPSNETLTNIASIFCDKLIGNGYKAGVYASYSWLVNQLSSPKLDKYDKWVAQWNDSCSYDKKYIMWQFTSKGKVTGILTDVDMDIYYR